MRMRFFASKTLPRTSESKSSKTASKSTKTPTHRPASRAVLDNSHRTRSRTKTRKTTKLAATPTPPATPHLDPDATPVTRGRPGHHPTREGPSGSGRRTVPIATAFLPIPTNTSPVSSSIFRSRFQPRSRNTSSESRSAPVARRSSPNILTARRLGGLGHTKIVIQKRLASRVLYECNEPQAAKGNQTSPDRRRTR